jgi:tRNA threonylcarbamoyladenosine biosynthesis protein TsaB
MPLRSAQKILAFDTASQRASIAFLEGSEVRAELRLGSIASHSTALLSCIDLLTYRIGWSLAELDVVAVGIGPGSFTGIRIGMATALGIAQSLSVPFTGISGLDALAHQAAWLKGRIGVLLNAHRSQVFYAEYRSDGSKTRVTQKSSLILLSDLERHLADRHLYIVGDVDIFRFAKLRRSSIAWPRVAAADLFLAASIGRLALTRKRNWCSGNYAFSEPLYIRPPDALRKKTQTR